MADATILMVGCAVTFTAIAGAYLVIREGYTRRTPARSVAAQSPVLLAGRPDARLVRRSDAA